MATKCDQNQKFKCFALVHVMNNDVIESSVADILKVVEHRQGKPHSKGVSL